MAERGEDLLRLSGRLHGLGEIEKPINRFGSIRQCVAGRIAALAGVSKAVDHPVQRGLQACQLSAGHRLACSRLQIPANDPRGKLAQLGDGPGKLSRLPIQRSAREDASHKRGYQQIKRH